MLRSEKYRKERIRSESTPRPIMILFCIYILAWFWQVGIRREWLGAIRFEFMLGALLALMALGFLATGQRERPPAQWPRGLLISAFVFFLFIAIQVPLSIVPQHSAHVFIERVFKFAFMGVFIMAFVKSTSDLKWVIGALLTAWAYLTFESFRAGLMGSMIWESQGIPRLRGDTPMFRHPNSLAGMASGVLPFAYFVFPLLKRRWLRVALVISVLTALGCIVYSGSRTAYVGVAALTVYLAYVSKRSFLKAVILTIVITMAGLLLMPEAYRARVFTLVTGEEIEGGSMDARLLIQKQAIAVFLENPIGVGVSAFPAARSAMFGRSPDTHNLYLEVATNLGFQGLVAFLLFIFFLVKTLWMIVRRSEVSIVRLQTSVLHGANPTDCHRIVSESITDYKWIRGISLAVTGYILVRLVMGLFGHDLYEIYWWLGLGLAVALWRLHERLDVRTHLLMDPTSQHPISRYSQNRVRRDCSRASSTRP